MKTPGFRNLNDANVTDNVLNSATILSQNNTYPGLGAVNAWQQPTQILGGRLMKFGVQLEF